VTLLFEMPHRFRVVTTDACLTHPSEEGLATPIAMVSREAESVFNAPPVSSVGDDTVLEEVNFAGLIIDKALLCALLPIRWLLCEYSRFPIVTARARTCSFC
jgi:hypothetical protein